MRPIPHISKYFRGPEMAQLYLDIDRAQPSPTGAPPGLVVTLPPAWGNKYQALLYQSAAAHRCAVVGVRVPADLAQISWPGPVVLHTHWFAALFNTAQSETEAQARLAEAQADVAAFRDRTGARLLWTAHNLYPHGNRFPETFLALRQWIFDTFDALHVLDEAHLPVLEAAFDRPAPPSFCVPHMTYAGIMPDTLDRAGARVRFGIPDTAFVVGVFGSLQGYKGIPALLDIVAQMNATDPAGQPVRAIVAGVPSDPDTVRQIRQRWGHSPWLHFLPQDIPDIEVQQIYRAADVMALPYDETLNSGAAFMAATFGTPFVMPDTLAARGLGPAGCVTYDATAVDGLRQALETCRPRGPGPLRGQTDGQTRDAKWHMAHAPQQISTRFMGEIARRLMAR